MTTAIVDLGAGNLHSAEKAFQRMAAEAGTGRVIVTDRAEEVARAERVVLPGDGAFPACMAALDAAPGMAEALAETVQTRARPFLGICIGMQMLATTGHEYTPTAGLGWIPGEVTAIEPGAGRKVPHMGWNDLRLLRAHPALGALATGDHAYFVHAWAFRVADRTDLIAEVDYGGPIAAVVGRANILGAQFHPEKSGRAGLGLIAGFLSWRP